MIATIHIPATTHSEKETKIWFEVEDTGDDTVQLQIGSSEPVYVDLNDLLRVVVGLNEMKKI